MKSIPWSIVALSVALLGSVTFLVWDGKLDSEVLVTLVSAITGGGLIHLGHTAGGSSAPPADPPPPAA